MKTFLVWAVVGLIAGVSAPQAAHAQNNGDGWWTPVVEAVQDGTIDARCRMDPSRAGCDPNRPGRRLPDAERRDGRTGLPLPGSRGGWGDRDDDSDSDSEARGRRGNGPPFCRNGEGHPVFGMSWCRDKGFAGGRWDRDARWERGSWEDVILRPRRNDRGILDRGGLADVLGDIILGRLESRAGGYGTLTGRWAPVREGRLLQVRAGSVPVAELLDRDGDGRADLVLLNRSR